MDWGPPGSSVHGILQARILAWVAMPSFRGSSWCRDWTWVSYVFFIGSSLPLAPPGKPTSSVGAAFLGKDLRGEGGGWEVGGCETAGGAGKEQRLLQSSLRRGSHGSWGLPGLCIPLVSRLMSCESSCLLKAVIFCKPSTGRVPRGPLGQHLGVPTPRPALELLVVDWKGQDLFIHACARGWPVPNQGPQSIPALSLVNSQGWILAQSFQLLKQYEIFWNM